MIWRNHIITCLYIFLNAVCVYSQSAVVSAGGWANTSKGLIHISLGEVAIQYGVVKEQGTANETGGNSLLFSDVKFYWNEGFLQSKPDRLNTALHDQNKEVLRDAPIQVYPNPFTEQIVVHVPQTPESELNVKVYNCQGAEVYNSIITGTMFITTNSYSSGLYTLVVYRNGQRVLSTKLIKTNQQ